jgi:MFS family permease
MSSPDRFAAEHWFLAHGLPAVVRRGALVRRVWSRSAPALAAFAVLAANSIVVVALSGQHTIDIAGRPTVTEGFILALLVLVLPVACLVGWLVSRIRPLLRRVIAANLSLAVIVLGAFLGGPTSAVFANLLWFGIIVGVILVLTATGVGSILGWAARDTASNLALISGMFVRALPVVLLTFLVFFNTYVWLMAAIVSRARLWLALGFLFLIAAAFLVSSTLERVRPILDEPDPQPTDQQRLAGTPFEHMPDEPGTDKLSHPERANVVFVVTSSQVGQVLTVALATGAIFFVLGLIVVSPELLDSWTRGAGHTDGHFLGMILPVPNALIQTTMMLTAITFMYLSAKAATDKEYRSQFLDPLLDEVRLTLVARDRYRSSLPKR